MKPKKQLSKLMAVILTAAMVLGAMPVTAGADTEMPPHTYAYQLIGNEIYDTELWEPDPPPALMAEAHNAPGAATPTDLPTDALENEDNEGAISTPLFEVLSYSPLNEIVAFQIVPFGTYEIELNLPAALLAEARISAQVSTPTDFYKTANVYHVPIAWEAVPEFNGEATGEYIFTARVHQEFSLAEGAVLPQIIVVVEPMGIVPLQSRFYVDTPEGLAAALSGGAATAGRHVVLESDITIPHGSPWVPIDGFRGTLDGAGHVIRNFHVSADRPVSQRTRAGLFGQITAGHVVIKNLGIHINEIGVNAGTFAGLGGLTSYAGGLIGRVAGNNTSVTIQQVYVKDGRINAFNEQAGATPFTRVGAYAGGLIGRIENGNPSVVINNSFTTCCVDAYATVIMPLFGTLEAHAGGLIGYNGARLTINNVYAAGEIRAEVNYRVTLGLSVRLAGWGPVSISLGLPLNNGTAHAGKIIGRRAGNANVWNAHHAIELARGESHHWLRLGNEALVESVTMWDFGTVWGFERGRNQFFDKGPGSEMPVLREFGGNFVGDVRGGCGCVNYPDCAMVHTGRVRADGARWWIYECGTLIVGEGYIDWDGSGWNGHEHVSFGSPWRSWADEITLIRFMGPITAGPSMRRLFNGLTNVTNIFGLHRINTTSVTDMAFMFSNAHSLQSLNLSSWDVRNVEDMLCMFWETHNLTELNLTGWNTASATSMSYMLFGARSLTHLDLSGWNTSRVTGMSGMFSGASGLTYLNLSGWDTRNVTNMSRMFYGAVNLSSLNLSGWRSNEATTSTEMFRHTYSLNMLTLGEHFRFRAAPSLPEIWVSLDRSPNFQDLPPGFIYTGFWRNVGGGTVDNPMGSHVLTSRQLVAHHNANPANETWVWDYIIEPPKIELQKTWEEGPDIGGYRVGFTARVTHEDPGNVHFQVNPPGYASMSFPASGLEPDEVGVELHFTTGGWFTIQAHLANNPYIMSNEISFYVPSPITLHTNETTLTIGRTGRFSAHTSHGLELSDVRWQITPGGYQLLHEWNWGWGLERHVRFTQTGEFTVRAYYVNDPSVYDEVVITVLPFVPITDIEIEYRGGWPEIRTGVSITLIAHLNHGADLNDTVRWSINPNYYIAGVDGSEFDNSVSKLVTFTQAGEFTVRAYYVNNPAVYDEVILTVVPFEPITNISISSFNLTVRPMQLISFFADINSGANPNYVRWSISPSGYIVDLSGFQLHLRFAEVGQFTVRAYYVNNPAVYDEVVVTVLPFDPIRNINISGPGRPVQTWEVVWIHANINNNANRDNIRWSVYPSDYMLLEEPGQRLSLRFTGADEFTVRAYCVNDPAVYAEVVITVTEDNFPPVTSVELGWLPEFEFVNNLNSLQIMVNDGATPQTVNLSITPDYYEIRDFHIDGEIGHYNITFTAPGTFNITAYYVRDPNIYDTAVIQVGIPLETPMLRVIVFVRAGEDFDYGTDWEFFDLNPAFAPWITDYTVSVTDAHIPFWVGIGPMVYGHDYSIAVKGGSHEIVYFEDEWGPWHVDQLTFPDGTGILEITVSDGNAYTVYTVHINPITEQPPVDITDDFECRNFLAAVREITERPYPERIYLSDVNWRTSLNVNMRLIFSLAGVEHFTALRELRVDSNQLTELDVSNNTALILLDVRYNQLTTLDVSNNTALAGRRFAGFVLPGLDVRNNFISSLNDVIGWQETGLVLGSGFLFDPQRDTVREITISPEIAHLLPGDTRQFGANVTASGYADATVTWSVIGNNATGTTINADGLLTVAENETAASLTVRATSTFDTSIYGTAAVTVEVPQLTATTVTVTPSTATVEPGQVRQFTATVYGVGNTASEFEMRVLELTNAERLAEGLNPLAWCGLLGLASRRHSVDMAVNMNDDISHYGSDGSTVPERIERVSGRPWLFSAMAENVAAGSPTPEAVVGAWMNSPGHRDNIMNPAFTHLGVGVHQIPGTHFFIYHTQKFGGGRAAGVPGTGVPEIEPPQSVTWSVSGNSAAGTTINANGLLTVAADETAGNLTVRAASTVYTRVYGSSDVKLCIPLLGDANRDGRITSADGTRLARHLAGHGVTIDLRGMDLDGNGYVDGYDLVLLVNWLMGHGAPPAVGRQGTRINAFPRICEKL